MVLPILRKKKKQRVGEARKMEFIQPGGQQVASGHHGLKTPVKGKMENNAHITWLCWEPEFPVRKPVPPAAQQSCSVLSLC